MMHRNVVIFDQNVAIGSHLKQLKKRGHVILITCPLAVSDWFISHQVSRNTPNRDE